MLQREWDEKIVVSKEFWQKIVVPGILKIRGDKCEMCGRHTKRMCVHHTSYIEINKDTLIVLCQGCHFHLHKKLKKTSIGSDYNDGGVSYGICEN